MPDLTLYALNPQEQRTIYSALLTRRNHLRKAILSFEEARKERYAEMAYDELHNISLLLQRFNKEL